MHIFKADLRLMLSILTLKKCECSTAAQKCGRHNVAWVQLKTAFSPEWRVETGNVSKAKCS